MARLLGITIVSLPTLTRSDATARVARLAAGRVGRFVAFLALTLFAGRGAAGSLTPAGSIGGLGGTGSGTGHLVGERTVGLLFRIIARGAGRGTLPRDAALCPAPDTGRPGQLMSLLVFNAGSSTLEFGLIDARAALRQNGARGRVGWSDPS